MILPILISVSVAPVSYLACSAAGAELAARIARAAEKATDRKWIAGILISLIWLDMSLFLIGSVLAPPDIQYLPQSSSKKKPPAVQPQGASFSRMGPGRKRTRKC